MLPSKLLNQANSKRTNTCSGSRINCYTWLLLLCNNYHVKALDLFGIGRGGSSSSTNNSNFNNPNPIQVQLIQQAAQLRAKLGPSPVDYATDYLSELLYFDSNYPCFGKSNTPRGFCNWLLPNRLMVGQYPGQTPEETGAPPEYAEQHLQKMAQIANIRLVCSLQTEVPPQEDYQTWGQTQGMIFLEPQSLRQRFPYPFTHYAPILRKYCNSERVLFLQCPIEDLNIPTSQEPLQELLLELLLFLNRADREAIYLHCWGGRGRAGLVGSCLLTLIYPHLTPQQILHWVQTGYASRLGHERMDPQLAVSPQTSAQRSFVAQFVQEYQAYYDKLVQEQVV